MDYRYERKFVAAEDAFREIQQFLLLHPLPFRRQYEPRYVNNVYFDTLDYQFYRASVNGDTNRTKVRVRWYGDVFPPPCNSVLECKQKRGTVGHKHRILLSSFSCPSRFRPCTRLLNMVSRADATNLPNGWGDLQPVLINRYCRHYFTDASHELCATVDLDVAYYGAETWGIHRFAPINDAPRVIVELKYSPQSEARYREFVEYFPFTATKCSKYVTGIRGL